jgi:pentatricopeptide repeat protein
MKEEGMAINEAVFLSLLTGHCLALDSASVASTLEVMAGSGLIIGPEVHAVVAASYGRAGDWDKVLETLEQAEAAGVVLDDGDLLSVMVGCCQGGLHRQAADHVQPRLPHKSGFFQVIVLRPSPDPDR